MHARIAAGQIVEVGIPTRLPVYFNGRWWDCRDATIRAAYIAAADWRPVTDTPAPADSGATTHDYSVTLVGAVPTVTWTARPWTAEELAARASAAVASTLTTDAAADAAKIAQAIADLLTLLGDDTQAGSIRAIMGPSGATAGTTSLRALRQQTNTAVVNAASIKAFIGLTINLAQRVIDDAQATRKVARQTLRLARLATGNYSTADVGTDD